MNVVLVEYPGYSIYKGESDADKILQNTEIVMIILKLNLTLMIKIFSYLGEV